MTHEEFQSKLKESVPCEWDRLPDIELYMDQLVQYLGRCQVEGTKDNDLTGAMINNYVKEGLLPRANGKRYEREHLTSLMIIACLKQVFSVKEIKDIKDTLQALSAEETHSLFRNLLIEAIEEISSKEESNSYIALHFAVKSYIYKKMSELVLYGGEHEDHHFR
ncbi:DUF1836 domain-containing protein [Guggenheimella bovis]